MAPNEIPKNESDTENPNENLKIPTWIKQEYFEDILKKDIEGYSKTLKFTPVAAAGAGENYASIMLRVHFEVELKNGKTEKVTYMLKTTHAKDTITASMTESMQLFPKENEMYSKLLPAFEKLYKEQGKDITFGPKSLNFTKDPGAEYVILEDLSKRNFKNYDRLKGLDMEHTERVLTLLAELHAASAVYFEKNGPYSEYFMKGMFNEKNRPMIEIITKSMKGNQERSIRQWPNGDYWVNKMGILNDDTVDKFMSLGNINENDFNVLNHGDCWVNNFMFRYNNASDEKLEETILIDFQLCKYGSPAQDLYYFLLSSVNVDIKMKNFDYFIKYYHENLIENLKLLKYSKRLPSLKDLHVLLLKGGQWGIFTTLGIHLWHIWVNKY